MLLNMDKSGATVLEPLRKKKEMAKKMPKHKGSESKAAQRGEIQTRHGFSGTENMNEMGGNTGIRPRK